MQECASIVCIYNTFIQKQAQAAEDWLSAISGQKDPYFLNLEGFKNLIGFFGCCTLYAFSKVAR
jgi:hypothetical protein